MHHLRELKALVEIEKEEWARKMQWLLRRACHITDRARERGVPLRPRLMNVSNADSGPSRTVIPAHCGQRSGDCGQFLMSV
jgi:hypothetical protein